MECGQCIRESEGHDKELEEALVCMKSNLLNVFRTHTDLMVP
jgi:hypothetical protein